MKVCSSETLVSTYKTSKFRSIAPHIHKRGTGCGEWLASRLGSFTREENVLYQLNGSLSDVLWRGKCPASSGNQTPDCPLRTLVTVLTAKFYIASKHFRRRHFDDAKIIGKLRNEDLHPLRSSRSVTVSNYADGVPVAVRLTVLVSRIVSAVRRDVRMAPFLLSPVLACVFLCSCNRCYENHIR